MNKTIGLSLGLISQYFQLLKFVLYKNIWRHVTFWVDTEVRDQKQEEAYAKVELIKEKYDHWEGRDTAELLLNNAIYIVIMTLILIVIIIEPKFLSIRVFRNIFTQSSVRLILALGVAGIIILQGTHQTLIYSIYTKLPYYKQYQKITLKITKGNPNNQTSKKKQIKRYKEFESNTMGICLDSKETNATRLAWHR